jgi:hypothetical protein
MWVISQAPLQQPLPQLSLQLLLNLSLQPLPHVTCDMCSCTAKPAALPACGSAVLSGHLLQQLGQQRMQQLGMQCVHNPRMCTCVQLMCMQQEATAEGTVTDAACSHCRS